MYYVFNGGEVLAITESPRFVKKKDGIWIECDKTDYEAIAVGGIAYEDAFAKEIDGGEIILSNTSSITENETAVFDVADIADENSNGVFELAEMIADIESRLEVLENA